MTPPSPRLPSGVPAGHDEAEVVARRIMTCPLSGMCEVTLAMRAKALGMP